MSRQAEHRWLPGEPLTGTDNTTPRVTQGECHRTQALAHPSQEALQQGAAARLDTVICVSPQLGWFQASVAGPLSTAYHGVIFMFILKRAEEEEWDLDSLDRCGCSSLCSGVHLQTHRALADACCVNAEPR